MQPEANVVTLDDRRRPAKSRLALLRDILETLPTIDLLYCDVAGIEDAFLTMTIDRLDASVRRLIVSTLSRQAELDLLELFSGRDWILEHERPCTVGQAADRSVASIEAGEQIWHNIRVSAR